LNHPVYSEPNRTGTGQNRRDSWYNTTAFYMPCTAQASKL